MEPQYVQLLSRTNCTTLDRLRSVDIAQLQTASQSLPFPDGDQSHPAPDGGLVPDRFYNLFEKGSFIRVPALIGDENDEGTQYAPNATSAEDVAVFINNNYSNLSPQQLDEINELYPKMDPLPAHEAYFPTASAVYGDMCFVCLGNEIAAALARYGNASSVWNYRYNVRNPGFAALGLGTHHDQDGYSQCTLPIV